MRRVQRMQLDARAVTYLRKRQTRADADLVAGRLNVEANWKAARQTKTMQQVLVRLQNMMGDRQRCMYCVDSHGCDIEHFRPKTAHPRRMFRWRNFLLCCTECGRIKGSKFPMQGSRPLLIDPSKEEPWFHLDFDPTTGNLSARFDLASNDFRPKGVATVATLQLDRREAMAAGYCSTWRRLSTLLQDYLAAPEPAENLVAALLDADDHGLLGWCFKGNGQNEPLPARLRAEHPGTWQVCLVAFEFR